MGGFCVTRPVDCCNAMESPLSEDKGPKKIVAEIVSASRIASITPDP